MSTNGCDPDETRNYLFDQSCEAVIELDGTRLGYTSGYCSCEGGRRAMLSSCDNVDRTEWRSCNEACNDTRVGVPANTVMTKNDEPTRDQWFYARAGQGIIAGFVALFLLVLVAFFCDKLCCRRNSMHLKKNHYLNHSMWTHPATSGIYNVLILLEILCNLLLLVIWVANLLPYVMFERGVFENITSYLGRIALCSRIVGTNEYHRVFT